MDAMKGVKDAVVKAAEANKRLLPAFVVIGVLVAVFIVRGMAGYHERLGAEVAESAERYADLSAMLAREGAVEAMKSSGEERIKELEAGLLRADKPNLAVAELEEVFKGILARRAISVVSQKAVGLTDRGPYTGVSVEFQLKASVPQIREMLYDIKASGRVMGASYLKIRHPNEKGAGKLDVVIVVDGAVRKMQGETKRERKY